MRPNAPLEIALAGLAIAIIGFLFLDNYYPNQGIIGNIINGKIQIGRNAIEYRFVFAVAVCLWIGAGYLWFVRRTPNSN